MIDITALGSTMLISLVSLVAFIFLWMVRDRRGAAQIALAAGGGGICVEILKRVVQRPRQTTIPPLVHFHGFSFPSGHALTTTATYAMLGAIACSYVQDRRIRRVIRLICAAVIALVAISRIYLGAHYPSDVAGGILIGLAWFLLIRHILAIRKPAPQLSGG